MKKSKIMNGDGDVGFAAQGPSITENGGNAGVNGCGNTFDAGKLNGEMAHVITTFDVDYDSGLFGDSLIIPIHQVSRAYRVDATAYSEWDKG